MSTIKFNAIELHTSGELPQIGQPAPKVTLTATDLSPISLEDYTGKSVLLNIYPSIDTLICLTSVRTFNETAPVKDDTVILCVSMDLPFALKRMAEHEALTHVTLLSDFRHRNFGNAYGVTILDGPFEGLLARAVLVLDEQHKVIYRELVENITHQPNYDGALSCLV